MVAVRVRAISPLWSLDRDLDYLCDSDSTFSIGQRVLVPLGKQKNPEMAVVIENLDDVGFATRPLASILMEPPIFDEVHLDFLKNVARRYCVSLGEVLQLAAPDFMPRVAVKVHSPATEQNRQPSTAGSGDPKRYAILTRSRSSSLSEMVIPDWVNQVVRKTEQTYEAGASVMLCVPEDSDVHLVEAAMRRLAPDIPVVAPVSNETKSQRYLRFRTLQSDSPKLAIVTRSGILWQMSNLGRILVHDELDDSMREQASPYYNCWEIALLRSSATVAVEFLSPYRSAPLQRLVEMGYVNGEETEQPIRNIEFSSADELASKSAAPFVKRCATQGTVLVVTTRRGSNSNLRCSQCGSPKTCSECGGVFWIDGAGRVGCKICQVALLGTCSTCEGSDFRPGKTGATRIATDMGKALPGLRIIEVDGTSPKEFSAKPNQVVIATVGSAPYLAEGYSGLLIYDASAWQSNPHPTSEILGYRDWLGALELLQPDAPVYLRNCDPGVAQRFALGQFVSTAKRDVQTALVSSLYPAYKYLRIECDNELASEAAKQAELAGAEVLKVTKSARSMVLCRLASERSLGFSDAFRVWLRLQKPSKQNPRKRPVTIEFDYEAWR